MKEKEKLKIGFCLVAIVLLMITNGILEAKKPPSSYIKGEGEITRVYADGHYFRVTFATTDYVPRCTYGGVILKKDSLPRARMRVIYGDGPGPERTLYDHCALTIWLPADEYEKAKDAKRRGESIDISL